MFFNVRAPLNILELGPGPSVVAHRNKHIYTGAKVIAKKYTSLLDFREACKFLGA